MDILECVNDVFKTEIEEIERTRQLLGESICEAIKMISDCKGKVAVCGMGKPGHIARKMASTFSSMGIASFLLHPAEAQHGDLGMIDSNDVIIIISNSGETAEICNLIPNLKIMRIPIIAITRSKESTLGKLADIVIETGNIREAGNLGLAPTSSTTVQLVIGDAIAVAVSKIKGFGKEKFALYHPAGALGKKVLTKVKDLMLTKDEMPIVVSGTKLKETIEVMAKTRQGAVVIIDEEGLLLGILTDGDLKRLINLGDKIDCSIVDEVMTKNPEFVDEDELAYEALKTMEEKDRPLHCLVAVDDKKHVTGLINSNDIINAHIFL